MVGNLYRRQVGGVAVLDGSKSHVLRLIRIELLDGILHVGHIAADGGIVVVNRAALPRAACARAAGDGDIADLEIVRRIVADGDAAITVGCEAAGAIDIVPFHIDIPQLGSDAIQLQVMDQIVVAFLVKEVVVGRAFGDRLKIHRITIGVYRFDSLITQREAAGGGIFHAAACKEFLCRLDLRIQAVHFCIVFPLGLQMGVIVMEIGELRDVRRQCIRRDLGNIGGVVGAIHFLIVRTYRRLISRHSVLVFGAIITIGILGLHGLLIGFEHILQERLFFVQHPDDFRKAFDSFGLLLFQRVQRGLGGFDFRRASGILHQDECISVHVRQALLYHLLL